MEEQYLNLLQKILLEGIEKSDRTGVGTLSLFGEKLEFDISKSIPILTTKKVFWKKVLIELLWFISGDTTIKKLQEQGVHFWDANTSREFLDQRGLKHYEEGTLGPGYGFQWRNFGKSYFAEDDVSKFFSDSQGVDQLANVIHLLKTDPFSRRIIITAWNPTQLDQVSLPPCHCFVQFNCVEINNEKHLDCLLVQRSCDCFLGGSFNIASYSFLTYMIAHIVGMKPRKFIHMIGDAHIYKNHIDAVKIQLQREPYEFPTLKFSRHVENIDDFKLDDLIVDNYKCHPYISAPMAI